jgi:hypothetical protein
VKDGRFLTQILIHSKGCCYSQTVAASLSALQVATAMCNLLGMVLPRVPNSVLRSRFITSSLALCAVLEKGQQDVSVAHRPVPITLGSAVPNNGGCLRCSKTRAGASLALRDAGGDGKGGAALPGPHPSGDGLRRLGSRGAAIRPAAHLLPGRAAKGPPACADEPGGRAGGPAAHSGAGTCQRGRPQGCTADPGGALPVVAPISACLGMSRFWSLQEVTPLGPPAGGVRLCLRVRCARTTLTTVSPCMRGSPQPESGASW